MRLFVFIVSFTFISSGCFSQDTLVNVKRFPYSDTALSIVYLFDTSVSNEWVAVESNNNATIYIRIDSIQTLIQRELIKSDYNIRDYRKILHELGRLKRGEIKDLTKLYSFSLRWILSEQIMSGSALIYDKQNQIYLSTVYHRINRVISMGYRTFYFSRTDGRYLYQVLEITGIIPNELMPDME